MTTLLSALTGPLLILFFLLTIGPCVVNRIIAFVRQKISAVQILMLHQQYQKLENDNEKYIELPI